MIDQDKRKAIFLLHESGMKIKEISQKLYLSRNTVRSIIKQRGQMPCGKRADKVQIDPQFLANLYEQCSGRIQRIHEKLTEEEGIKVGYSTLSRLIRELHLGGAGPGRCHRVPDEPGIEMQHDTSPYTLLIGDKKVRVVASLLYYRYSKIRYVKFYRSFDRFCMKCFFHEALSFWGYSAKVCIIDNTNLARLRGTGKRAVIVPEMEEFAATYGFRFQCHEVGHPNRKAGNERSFWTLETNFFPGRTFESLEDLNQQAFEWATVKIANRPVSKTGLIPAKAFDHEKSYLIKLAPYICAPYLVHKRIIDQYGYLPFDGNFYWVPGTSRGDVLVLQYSGCLKIYLDRELLVEYPLPPDRVKNEAFTPPGFCKPKYQPKHRIRPTAQEEKILRSLAAEVDAYLQFVLKPKGKEKHRIIRQLFGLYRKVAPSVFIKAIKRAHTYRIMDVKCVERIAFLQIQQGDIQIPSIDIDEQFQERQTYREGRLSGEVDLSIYEKMLDKED